MELPADSSRQMLAQISEVLDTHAFLSGVQITSFEHRFKGFGTHPSKIRVHTFRNQDNTIVVFEDLNQGTSVTNASEQLANEIRALLSLNPDPLKTAWIEVYPYNVKNGFNIGLDQVIYDYHDGKFSKPKWRPVQNSMIADFIKRLVL